MRKLISIWLIECLVNLYDLITLPIYYLFQQPWKARQEALKVRAIQVENFTWVSLDSKLEKKDRKLVTTLDELFRDSVATYPDKDALGVRKVLGVEYALQNGNATPRPLKNNAKISNINDKKVVSKLDLDDQYTWHTYRQIEATVVQLSAGLIGLCGSSIPNSDGLRKVLICADTCMQWFLMAHASFRNSITVVTAYTSLDNEAILSTIHETQVKVFVVSQSFTPRVAKIVERAPSIDTVIVLDEPLPGQEEGATLLKPLLTGERPIRILKYSDLIARGKEVKENITEAPNKDDIAVLMYTSGSTGKPKGVMLSHQSIVYTALTFSGPGLSCNDRFIGYLPLGHVLELAAECIFLRNGCTIAYSSAFTLTNQSPYIKPGQLGDCAIFKPTILAAVPLVLERIKNALQSTIKSRGPFYDQLFNKFVIEYKRYWWDRYYDTPLLNLLLLRKFQNIFGGHMRAICSGGAALSKETQEYMRHITATNVIQGYGLTETSAAASFSDVSERRYNVVGVPYPTVHLKLESWSDYSVHDKPYPRGEIIIGGLPVSSGYYKMKELTDEMFYTDSKTGMRFFRTGDVGLMLPDGVLKIIDRKKDIVKPLSGEYISLSAIEAALSGQIIVESLCVYCSQHSNYIVSIVRPNAKELRNLAIKKHKQNRQEYDDFRKSIREAFEAETGDAPVPDEDNAEHLVKQISLESLCSNKWLIDDILRTLQKAGAENGLKKTQIPSNIHLASEEWTLEAGLVTASFKIRRREIEKFYENDIKRLYRELGQNIEQNS